MMKKCILLLTLIFTLFFTTACVQEEKESTTPNPNSKNRGDIEELNDNETQEEIEVENEEAEGSKGFLWKTRKGKNTIYLLGSVHFGTKDIYPLSKEILEAFEESDYLVVESDNTNSKEAEIALFLEKNAKYSEDDDSLKENLSTELYIKVDEALQSFHLKVEHFNQFKPWYILFMLQTMKIQELGYDGYLGIDQYFLNNVRDNMGVLELEDSMVYTNLFSNLTEDVQMDLLKATVENLDKAEMEMAQIMTAWKTGNWSSFITLDNDFLGDHEEFNKVLVNNRNIGMVEKIEEYLNSQDGKTYFVVVGAGHFVGEMGIIHLLQEKGYEVNKK